MAPGHSQPASRVAHGTKAGHQGRQSVMDPSEGIAVRRREALQVSQKVVHGGQASSHMSHGDASASSLDCMRRCIKSEYHLIPPASAATIIAAAQATAPLPRALRVRAVYQPPLWISR